MPILIFAFVLGGIILVSRAAANANAPAVTDRDGRFASISSVVTPERFADRYELPANRPAAHVSAEDGSERFADPKYQLLGGPAYVPIDRVVRVQGFDSAAKPGDVVPDLIGYEYLARVPNVAAQRVAAMRAKINNGPRPTEGSAPLVKSSALVLESFATTLYNSMRSKDGVRALATSLGVSDIEIEKQSQKVLSLFSTGNPSADQIVASLFRTYSAQLADLFRQVTRSLVGEAASAAAASIAGAIGKAVPLLQILTSMGEAAVRDSEANAAADCRTAANTIKRAAEDSAALGYPIPWHAADVYGLSCNRVKSILGLVPYDLERGGIANVGTIYARNLVKTQKLTLPQRAEIKKWWSLCTSLASVPEVRAVLETMCIDSFGGQWASDEQVMVVCAPIAVSHGLRIDDLATEVWKQSRGWRGADPLGYQRALHDTDRRDADDYVIREFVETDPPINAFQLQLAVLAEDAFRIAASMPRPMIKLSLVSAA